MGTGAMEGDRTEKGAQFLPVSGLCALRALSLRGASILLGLPCRSVAHGERSGVRVGEGGIRGRFSGNCMWMWVGAYVQRCLAPPCHLWPADLGARPADSGVVPARVPSPALSLAQEAPPKMGISRDRNRAKHSKFNVNIKSL